MAFQDHMETSARRFLDFIKESCYNSITRLFSPPVSVRRIKLAQPIDMEITSSVDSVLEGMEACTPNCQSKNGKDKSGFATNFTSPKSRDKSDSFQETGNKHLSTRSVIEMENVELTPDFFGETQAIKQQKLGGGRTRQIMDCIPLSLPHKLSPDRTGGATNSYPSSVKVYRKIYVRENSTSCTSVAEMVKRFESRTGEVYLQKTGTPPISPTHTVSVPEIVKQFEFKTREMSPKAQPCEFDSPVRHKEELEHDEAQKPIIMKDRKARTPLMDLMESVQDVDSCRAVDIVELDGKMMKEKENIYKRFREENECSKLAELHQTFCQFFQTEEETGESKRLRKYMVLNAKPFPKEITVSKSPISVSKQRSANKISGSSPATNMR